MTVKLPDSEVKTRTRMSVPLAAKTALRSVSPKLSPFFSAGLSVRIIFPMEPSFSNLNVFIVILLLLFQFDFQPDSFS